MGEEKLAEVLKFEKERQSMIDSMEEEAFEDTWWFTKVPFKPNLLNTMVWLVEVSQQISVLFVNYKGRPWMKGMLENQALFLSLFACIGLVWVTASNAVPFVNEQLKLEVVPYEPRAKMMACLGMSLFGALIWDRLMHFIFAREIFNVMLENIYTTTFEDFRPVLKTVAYVGGALLVLGSGNILTAISCFYLYKTFNKPAELAAGAAPAAS